MTTTYQPYELTPVNGVTLVFNGRIIAEKRTADIILRVYETDQNRYIAECVEYFRDEDPMRPQAEQRAWVAKSPEHLARIVLGTRCGLRRDDPDRWILRAVLTQAGKEFEAKRRV